MRKVALQIKSNAAVWPLHYAAADGFERIGTVEAVSGDRIRVRAPGLIPRVAVRLHRGAAATAFAEVTEVEGSLAWCSALSDTTGVQPGTRVSSVGATVGAFVGTALLGHDADAWGRSPTAPQAVVASIDSRPFARAPISRALCTGVPAIDAFATLGYGQRVALIAGAGVGKSTLLVQLVERAAVDARVVALIGERGREAAELIDRLRDGSGASAATTTITATSSASARERLAAASTATAHAEALAAEGCDVLLVMDSLTRVATAWRELALANGEQATSRGHPPSLASAMARIVERAGARTRGSITAVYAVLVEGDDPTEPVSDTVRALLDGHIVLSRAHAERGRFPAVDVLRSLSRLMHTVATPQHRAAASAVRAAIAVLEQAEDLFAIGAYRPGADARLDMAVALRAEIEAFIFSGDLRASMSETAAKLFALARRLADA